MNNSVFIIAQILGFIAFLISLIAYHRKKKQTILGTMILSNFFNLMHYLLLDALSGGVTKVIAVFRDLFILSKSKNKLLSSNIFLIIFILIYITAGILNYNGIFSIFPTLAALVYIVPVWNGNELTIKKTAFVTYFLWLIYNTCVFSISGILSNLISIVSTFIAIKRKKQELKS